MGTPTIDPRVQTQSQISVTQLAVQQLGIGLFAIAEMAIASIGVRKGLQLSSGIEGGGGGAGAGGSTPQFEYERPLTPEAATELGGLNRRIAGLMSREERQNKDAVEARIHYQKLLRQYGYTLEPPLVEMNKHKDLRIAKARAEYMEKQASQTRVQMYTLTRRKKQITGKEEIPYSKPPAMKKPYAPPEVKYQKGHTYEG